MDFFILLSSLVGIYGSIAQCNYAAGCAFQDALARHRTSILGLPTSVSLDLGWFSTIGIISENQTYLQHRMHLGDMDLVDEKDLFVLLGHYCDPARGLQALSPDSSQLLVGATTPADLISRGEQPMQFMDRPMWAGFEALRIASGRNTILAPHQKGTPGAAQLFREATGPVERGAVVVEALRARLARALGVEVDAVDARGGLSTFGVDSLMAVELRNWIKRDFGAVLSVYEMIGAATLSKVAELVATRAEWKGLLV